MDHPIIRNNSNASNSKEVPGVSRDSYLFKDVKYQAFVSTGLAMSTADMFNGPHYKLGVLLRRGKRFLLNLLFI